MILTFEKDEHTRWYAVIPEWEGERAELEMIMGADALCDILSHNQDYFHARVDDHLTDYTRVILHRWKPKGDMIGAYYRADFESTRFESFDIWLCPVTEFVFGGYPNVMYIS